MKIKFIPILLALSSLVMAAPIVRSKQDLANNVVTNRSYSNAVGDKLDYDKVGGLTITAAELNMLDPSGKGNNFFPVSDGAGNIIWIHYTPNSLDGLTISVNELNMFDPTGKANGLYPISNGDGTITWSSTAPAVGEIDPVSLHLAGGTMSGNIISRDVIPAMTSQYNLGTSTYPFYAAYAQNMIAYGSASSHTLITDNSLGILNSIDYSRVVHPEFETGTVQIVKARVDPLDINYGVNGNPGDLALRQYNPGDTISLPVNGVTNIATNLGSSYIKTYGTGRAGWAKILTTNNNDYISVKDFGVKANANNDSGEDDTIAIRAAITATPTHGVLFFPKGVYRVAPQTNDLAVFTIDKPMNIYFEDKYTEIRFTGTNTTKDMFLVKPTIALGDIQGFNLKGGFFASESEGQLRDFIRLDVTNGPIYDIIIDGTWDYGHRAADELGFVGNSIHTVNTVNRLNGFFTSRIQNSHLYHGVNLADAGDSITVRDNVIRNDAGDGIYYSAVIGIYGTAHNFDAYGNNIIAAGNAVHIGRGDRIHIHDNNMEYGYDGRAGASFSLGFNAGKEPTLINIEGERTLWEDNDYLNPWVNVGAPGAGRGPKLYWRNNRLLSWTASSRKLVLGSNYAVGEFLVGGFISVNTNTGNIIKHISGVTGSVCDAQTLVVNELCVDVAMPALGESNKWWMYRYDVEPNHNSSHVVLIENNFSGAYTNALFTSTYYVGFAEDVKITNNMSQRGTDIVNYAAGFNATPGLNTNVSANPAYISGPGVMYKISPNAKRTVIKDDNEYLYGSNNETMLSDLGEDTQFTRMQSKKITFGEYAIPKQEFIIDDISGVSTLQTKYTGANSPRTIEYIAGKGQTSDIIRVNQTGIDLSRTIDTIDNFVITSSDAAEATTPLKSLLQIGDVISVGGGLTNINTNYIPKQSRLITLLDPITIDIKFDPPIMNKQQFLVTRNAMHIGNDGRIVVGKTDYGYPFQTTGASRFDGQVTFGNYLRYISSKVGRGVVSSSGVNVTGSGTLFTLDLAQGDLIIANGQTRYVATIISNTALTTSVSFSPVLASTSFNTQTNPYTNASIAGGLGTGTITNASGTVTGVGTRFTKEVKFGDSIWVGGTHDTVASVVSDTSLTMTSGSTLVASAVAFNIAPLTTEEGLLYVTANDNALYLGWAGIVPNAGDIILRHKGTKMLQISRDGVNYGVFTSNRFPGGAATGSKIFCSDCSSGIGSADIVVSGTTYGVGPGTASGIGATGYGADCYRRADALWACDDGGVSRNYNIYKELPIGFIGMIASTFTVPVGWQLCNGGTITSGPLSGQSTPNLTDRFPVGVGSTYLVGTLGGSRTYPHTITMGGSISVASSFNSGITASTNTGVVTGSFPSVGYLVVTPANGYILRSFDVDGTPHSHTVPSTSVSGNVSSSANISGLTASEATTIIDPPYCPVKFIERIY